MMLNSRMEQVVRLNTLSPIVMTKSVLRSMMADGCGRIVNIASPATVACQFTAPPGRR